MPKVVAIVIARMGSTRLPGKVLMPLGGSAPVVQWVWDAAYATKGVDEVWVATTTLERDNALVAVCDAQGVPYHRGSEDDVLARFHDCAVKSEADIVIRMTGDCPFHDPRVIDQLIAMQRKSNCDFVSNVNPATWPDGLDCEVFTMEALAAAHKEATTPSDRDTVTQYISRNRHRWPSQTLTCPIPGMHRERWVLDTEDDYKFCQEIARRLEEWPPAWTDILSIIDAEPKLRFINQTAQRNERFLAKIADELDTGPRTYQATRSHLTRALKVTPYGAGTYSKSYVAYGRENGPLYLSHGDGPYVVDLDGNRYVDMVSGLTAVILGHCDVDVDSAVRDQLCSGVGLSLPTTLEAELAEELSALVPCAEMSFFCKNGSDATAAAVRLARGVTQRDEVVMFRGAYHGWHDWSLEVPRDYGIVENGHTINIPSKHPLKDIDWVKDVAAVIVEPDQHEHSYLVDLRIWCEENGILFIFDECLTGLRYPGWSYQAFSGVKPDLAVFGKGLANGYSCAALCGRARHMERMAPGTEPNVFFSGTHFGEAVPLRAAIATLAKVIAHKVPDKLYNTASELSLTFTQLAHKHGVHLEIGPPPLCRFKLAEMPAFRHHMAQAGVLIYGFFGLNFAHTSDDIRRVQLALDYALSRIAAGDTNYTVPQTGIMRR